MDKSIFVEVGFFILLISPVLLAIFLYAYMARKKALWRKAIGRNKSKAQNPRHAKSSPRDDHVRADKLP